jgi:hypothetical protein
VCCPSVDRRRAILGATAVPTLNDALQPSSTPSGTNSSVLVPSAQAVTRSIAVTREWQSRMSPQPSDGSGDAPSGQREAAPKRGGHAAGLCVGHVRQFGGESPLCNLMEVKH